MNMIINCLCNFLNFTQLELYIQRGNNKRANLENIKKLADKEGIEINDLVKILKK